MTPATTASFEFVANEDGTFECKLDGPGTTTGTWAQLRVAEDLQRARRRLVHVLDVHDRSGGEWLVGGDAIVHRRSERDADTDVRRRRPRPVARRRRRRPSPTPTPVADAVTVPDPEPAGCVATNGTDVPIADLSTVESPITITGCAGNASATATVEVHIVHTYIGDLIVTLIAPDGSTYPLHNRAGGSTDDIDQTYTTNLVLRAGQRHLEAARPRRRRRRHRPHRRLDHRPPRGAPASTPDADTHADRRRASPTPSPSPSPGAMRRRPTAPTCRSRIYSTVESPITITGCTGNASATATVEVHIVHTYIGDLIVTLIAPDGSTYPLHNRAGGSTDNIDQTYTTNLVLRTRQRHLEAPRPRRRRRRHRPHRRLDHLALAHAEFA